MTHDPFGNTPNQGTLHPPTSMTANYDDICGPCSGGLYNLGSWLADLYEFEWSRVQRKALTEIGKQPFAILFDQFNYLGWGDPTLRAKAKRGGNSKDKRYFGRKRTGKFRPNVGGMGGDRVAIDRDEKFAETHLDFPVR